MPELPEVEITARNLRAWAVGHRIERVEAEPSGARLFRPLSPATLARRLAHRRTLAVDRRGKQLLVTLEGPTGREGLASHLGMTGRWVRRASSGEVRFSRVRLFLEDGAVLHYADPRLLGRLRLVPGARFDEVPEIAALGRDPLDEGIDVDALQARLARARRAIKVAIMDQALLPGVGNIVATEALFRARIDPRRLASSLGRAELDRLAAAIVASIRDTIARESGPELAYVNEGAENPFAIYGRAGERCPRCRTSTLRRVVLGQRGSVFCPRCQR